MVLDDPHCCFICNADIGEKGDRRDAAVVREALEVGWKPITRRNAPRVAQHTPLSARPRSSQEAWLHAVDQAKDAAGWLCKPCGEEFRMLQRVRVFEATYKKETLRPRISDSIRDSINDTKYTSEALLQPVMTEDVDELTTILQDGVDDIDGSLTDDGLTALHTVVTINNPALIRLLLLAGADPAARITTGENAVDLAEKWRTHSLDGEEVYQLLRAVRPQLAPQDTAAFSLQQLPEAAGVDPSHSKGWPLATIAIGVALLIIIVWVLM